jgi:uncharacterized protein YeeX (DUF496 family)
MNWGKLEGELYWQLRNYLSRPMADQASKEIVENMKTKYKLLGMED